MYSVFNERCFWLFQDPNWYRARNTVGREGTIPANYVQKREGVKSGGKLSLMPYVPNVSHKRNRAYYCQTSHASTELSLCLSINGQKWSLTMDPWLCFQHWELTIVGAMTLWHCISRKPLNRLFDPFLLKALTPTPSTCHHLCRVSTPCITCSVGHPARSLRTTSANITLALALQAQNNSISYLPLVVAL